MQQKHKNLRIVFAGTPEISATVLQGLIDNNQNIVGVFTQPDRTKGRGRKLQASPVKQLASSQGIEVFQPVSFKKEPQAIEALKALKPDVMVVIAYGLILPKEVLDVPKAGCINIHVSLLPKWRGAAPIQRAIEAGDEKMGITIMQMDEGLDTGDILYQIETEILNQDTAASLHDRLAQLSVPAVIHVLAKIEQDCLQPQKQDDTKATYAAKLTKEEGRINWALSANEISRKFRAFDPWPGSFIIVDDQVIKVTDVKVCKCHNTAFPGEVVDVTDDGIKVQTAKGCLIIGTLQFPGKKMQAVKSLQHGYALKQWVGKVFGS
ncbi:methionyl-tRNA formyltransferase [Facilibium subflavum]|uniref:methionyl-tRNA formyltransferase n=1 Tax=Facilibium subflavum TaxID=2219058 RepID=UPI000E658C81|nr:methionyl-tRNA formyltransferase [Facilibium subflavum]